MSCSTLTATGLAAYFDPQGPGAALAVLGPDGQSRIECRGLADLETRCPITPETLFDLASASKPFTALATLRLVDAGCLDLDAAIVDYLPALSPNPTARPIRVRDLLQHSSDLPDYLASGLNTPPEERRLTFLHAQLEAWCRNARPGQRHEYANTNYVVLALIIEAVTGKRWAQHLSETLIEPLGLRNTFAGGPPRGQVLARGIHNFGHGLGRFHSGESIALDTVGDGGVYSSLNDMIRWQAALWRGELLEPGPLAWMLEPGRLDDGERFDYGLGMQIESGKDGCIWQGHGGSWTDSTVMFGRYLPAQISVIILSNEFMAPVERMSQCLWQNLVASAASEEG
ncbi:serine hydrolase domain-containing protein [Wenzhouxiangella marina]|uniref:Uncharacterized protein n=1 Tax=Wenzhouxiangella marina TaxID=1579979 RepID=A0A0K0XU27_9GAMM|nr:serine hydrolase domain-containing protein [Wenzhouxiangella marina]AKS41131.1 hypothetical protein WM2015_750 [Wenzhouxiangella marina]MBB6088010.1 CubicO group peptidase (beta-lactamase class C family) [Wenzhouxiangella marina]